MPPRLTFLLTFLGVLAAGAPLPFLTRNAAPQQQTETATQQSSEWVFATVQFTGKPTRLEIHHAGKLLAALPKETYSSPWETELELPAGCSHAEPEVYAEWSEPGSQAVTITLEPPARAADSCTRWSDSMSNTLHHIFTFTW